MARSEAEPFLGTSDARIVLDTSVLINFVCIDRIHLLGGLPFRFVVTEHVVAEVTMHYPAQRARLDMALAAGVIERHDVTDPLALDYFNRLSATGRLGAGECAAIAYALVNDFTLAIEDRRAEKEALSLAPSLRMFRTADLVVLAIRDGLLTLAQEDEMKDEWAAQHRFRLKIKSFQELM